MEKLYAIYENSATAGIIIPIALMLFCGFAVTRLTKLLHLPNVTAYILTGVLLGPYCFDMVPESVIDGMGFLSDIALAFIAFGTGEFFRFSELKKNGVKVIVIAVFETMTASVLVFLTLYFLLSVNLAFSIVLASLAAATASASTMMTIRQTGAAGDFVSTLLQVVAVDNMIALLAYGIAISVATAFLSGSAVRVSDIVKPLLTNIGVMGLGCLFGVLLKLLMPKRRSADNRLIISVATLFAFCGICALMDVSPLLGCMSMGTVYINFSQDEKIFKQLNYFSPPLLLLFFVRSGLNFKLNALTDADISVGGVSLLVIGVFYFLVRIVGKYIGAFFGCLTVKKTKKVRDYLGLALIPQAGVSIGLSVLGARAIGGEMGMALETVILASGILYELVGPACAQLSLFRSGSYTNKLEELVPLDTVDLSGKPKTAVDLLIERIAAIQKTLPEHLPPDDNEQAFSEGAEEQYQIHYRPGPLRFFGRNRR